MLIAHPHPISHKSSSCTVDRLRTGIGCAASIPPTALEVVTLFIDT